MKDQILTYLKDNEISLSKLSQKIGASEKKLGYVIHLLKNEGYDIREKYDYLGNIIYYLGNPLIEDKIVIDNKGNNLRALIISDMHIGQNNDGMENLYKVIEYAKANDIHIIFNLGDLFEGVGFNKYDDSLTMEEQIDRFFKLYPYNSNILHFNLLGNHDLSIPKNCGLDIGKKIVSRPDIINLGYGSGIVQIGEDFIGFKHDLECSIPNKLSIEPTYVWKGHSHCYIYNGYCANVPALLDKDFYSDLLSCGFLDVVLNMNNDNLIDTISMKYIALLNEPRAICDVITTPNNSKIKKKI